MADLELIVLTHPGGEGLEEMAGREISVPVSAVPHWEAVGWERKPDATPEDKAAAEPKVTPSAAKAAVTPDAAPTP